MITFVNSQFTCQPSLKTTSNKVSNLLNLIKSMKLIWEQPQCSRSSNTLKEPVLFFNCLKASLEPLVFAEAFSCTPHYKSNTMPFDPSPKAQGERIDPIMGLSEFLAPHQSRIAAALKKHGPFKLVNLQVLAFLLNFTSCSGQNWIPFKFLFPVR